MTRIIRMLPAAVLLAAWPLHAQGTTTPTGRVFAKGGWVQVARITDDAGRIFANPALIAARGDTAYVYDGGSQELIAIQKNGALLWRVGRAGRGPREFSNPVDLRLAANGDLHVLDADVARITIVSTAGRVVGMRPVEERLHRIIPRASGWWAVALSRPQLLVSVNASGRAARDRDVPAPADIVSRHVLVREPFTAALPNEGVVLTFVWASRVLFTDGDGRVVADLSGPEPVPFASIRSYAITEPKNATVQRIDPKARLGARDVTANDSMALVLFGGGTRDRGKLLDRYDLESKRYVDSSRLPRQPLAIRLSGKSLVALESEPAPAIVWYEWRGAAR